MDIRCRSGEEGAHVRVLQSSEVGALYHQRGRGWRYGDADLFKRAFICIEAGNRTTPPVADNVDTIILIVYPETEKKIYYFPVVILSY